MRSLILILLCVVGSLAQSGISGHVEPLATSAFPRPTQAQLRRCVINVSDSITGETVAKSILNPGLNFNLRWRSVNAHPYHLEVDRCPNVTIQFFPRDMNIFTGEVRQIDATAWMLKYE